MVMVVTRRIDWYAIGEGMAVKPGGKGEQEEVFEL
jgi:inner membrane protein involved in colicin E2 resistance